MHILQNISIYFLHAALNLLEIREEHVFMISVYIIYNSFSSIWNLTINIVKILFNWTSYILFDRQLLTTYRLSAASIYMKLKHTAHYTLFVCFIYINNAEHIRQRGPNSLFCGNWKKLSLMLQDTGGNGHLNGNIFSLLVKSLSIKLIMIK